MPGEHAADIDRISPTRRPAVRAIGHHRWSNLLFVHWQLPAEVVQPLLPAGLTLDTWDGTAWVGLVPFQMSGIRPWWSPAIPGISNFLETNVRTYVHFRGEGPGVWFFSLEAPSSLAVRIARWRWHLPYHRSVMDLQHNGDRLQYKCRRLWPGEQGAGCEINVELGPAAHENGNTATPGTLEHFLIERYLLYSQSHSGQLLRGQVHHAPYPLRTARLIDCHDSLLAAAGMPPQCEPCHAIFSPGVQVEVFPLELC